MAKVYSNGTVTLSVPASQKIAVFSKGDSAKVYQKTGYPNYPDTWELLTTVTNTEYLSSAFSTVTEVRIDAGVDEVLYSVGASPQASDPQADIVGADDPFKITGEAATDSAAATAAGASGAVTIQSAVGGANTGGASGEAGGAGGAISITGGAGGATNSTGAHDAGAGADVTITAGAGGAASAGTGDGGAGGSISLVPGAGGSSSGGSAGVPGAVIVGGTAGGAALALNVTRNTVSDSGTVTVAQHRAMVLYQDASGGAVTMTSATGSDLAAAFPDLQVGNAIPQYVASNHASNTSTISGGTGVTLVGSGAVTNTGGSFLLIKTAAATFDLVRVG